MFGVFLCMRAFIHAHTHVFVLIQKCVYVSLNRIKTSEKNAMNPAAKAHNKRFNSGTFFVFFSSQWRRQNAGTIRATRPAAQPWPHCSNGLQRRPMPWASVTYFIYNEVSSPFTGWMPPSPAIQNSRKVFRCFSLLVPMCREWGASYRCAPRRPTCSHPYT